MDTPSVIVAAKKINWFKIILVLLGIALLIAIFVYIRNVTKVSWSTIKTLISQDAANYPQPASVEKILLAGAQEIVFDPSLLAQAKEYAKSNGISLERVIVNNSLALAKNFNYIPS